MRKAARKTISAAEANRRFSKLLRAVREGGTFIVTSHGKPVAQITPVMDVDQTRRRAKGLLLARLRVQPSGRVEPWTREEVHERP